MDSIDKIKKRLSTKKTKAEVVDWSKGISSGSTLLNLACSDRPGIGFLDGRYVFLVGDSASGKTFLSLTCLAEAANNKRYNDYRFIYDNAEDGALMNLEKFFGNRMASRLEPPKKDKQGNPIFSNTIEDFYYNLDDALDNERPCIYILDSMDSLSSEDEGKKFLQHKNARKKILKGDETKVAGSYGDGKAKKNSANLRRIIPKLRRNGSILIVINQTRDNVGSFSFEKKTRSGGHALRFYATLELWSSVVEKIKKTVRGKPRKLGIVCRVQVKKNRLTGRETIADIPIYWSTGIDDLGSLIDYLIDEGHWKDTKGTIEASEFEYEGSREGLVKRIEEEGKEDELKILVSEVWADIQAACEVKRKKRYE